MNSLKLVGDEKELHLSNLERALFALTSQLDLTADKRRVDEFAISQNWDRSRFNTAIWGNQFIDSITSLAKNYSWFANNTVGVTPSEDASRYFDSIEIDETSGMPDYTQLSRLAVTYKTVDKLIKQLGAPGDDAEKLRLALITDSKIPEEVSQLGTELIERQQKRNHLAKLKQAESILEVTQSFEVTNELIRFSEDALYRTTFVDYSVVHSTFAFYDVQYWAKQQPDLRKVPRMLKDLQTNDMWVALKQLTREDEIIPVLASRLRIGPYETKHSGVDGRVMSVSNFSRRKFASNTEDYFLLNAYHDFAISPREKVGDTVTSQIDQQRFSTHFAIVPSAHAQEANEFFNGEATNIYEV